MTFTHLALLTGLASSWYMTGLVVFVQVVHYPLFAKVDRKSFPSYHANHVRLTTSTVFPPMLLELASAVVLAYQPPEGTSTLAWSGLIAATITWIATAFLSVPRHETLAKGFEEDAHRALVRTNLVRLGAWIVHDAILLMIVAEALR